MLTQIQQWVLPTLCCLCGQCSREDICSTCQGLLPWVSDSCFQCGSSLQSGLDSIRCANCLDQPPNFDRLCALFYYEPPLKKMLSLFKFSGQLAYGRVLGDLLAKVAKEQWYKNGGMPQAFLPVPLHQKRFLKRGFNQALELTLVLKKEFSLPVLRDTCVRVKNTPPQLSLNRAYRSRNVRSAFQLQKPLRFEHVAIVDDVVTTGNTVSAISQLLKDNGVEQVDVWCVCRT